jgi:hypothetical protein
MMKFLTAFIFPVILFCGAFAPALYAANDGLDELNQYRAQRGLKPFARDQNLSAAAGAAADYRATHLIKGHVNVVVHGRQYSDYDFLPAGSPRAHATGCAAAGDEWGWLSCCANENWTYAGAAWTRGRNGQRYMHLFVRN